MATTYAIHSTVRGQQSRTQRAAQPSHHRLKQYIGDKQQRLLRGRPIRLGEDEFMRCLADIKAKAAQGILEVRTESGQLVNLDTLEPSAPAPVPPLPNPPLDSIKNDAPWGQEVPAFAGDDPSTGGEPSLLTNMTREEEEPEHASFVTSATEPAPEVEETAEAADAEQATEELVDANVPTVPDTAPETAASRSSRGGKKGKR